MSRACAVEGCDSPVLTKDWCGRHYTKWRRHGDPLGGRTGHGEPMAFIRNVVMKHDTNDCLFWPFARSTGGYAFIRQGDGFRVVSNLVCELTHGPAPTPSHEAAHSCNHGDDACVNRHHLRWATAVENADKAAHGTQQRGENNPNAMLTEALARTILAAKGTAAASAIAASLGTTKDTVWNIHSGRRWPHLQEHAPCSR